MSRPITAGLTVGALIILSSAVCLGTATAADLQIPQSAVRAGHYQAASACGPCGCLHVTYDYHRELRSTFGVGFDPRNFDTTEPYFYYGAVRAYPHYWCEVGSAQ
jgi:hypothetical protein